jgi:hypothetical protein
VVLLEPLGGARARRSTEPGSRDGARRSHRPRRGRRQRLAVDRRPQRADWRPYFDYVVAQRETRASRGRVEPLEAVEIVYRLAV